MLTIPKKYLKPSQTVAALQLVRTWFSKGLLPIDGVRQIYEAYKEARSEEAKLNLGFFMATFLEDIKFILSDECARRFKFDELPLNFTGIKGSLVYFIKALGNNNSVVWRRSFTQSVLDFHSLNDLANQYIINTLFYEFTIPGLFVIHPKEEVFAMGDYDRRSLTLVIGNGCNDDVLIDENVFGNEPPLYFTESYHFISPIYKLKLVKAILEYILLQIGFPYFKIKMVAIFYGRKVNLINRDDYIDSKDWENIEVMTPKDTIHDYYLASSSKMLVDAEEDTPVVTEIKHTLINALKATAIVCDKIYTLNKFVTLTPATLRQFTDGIFTS